MKHTFYNHSLFSFTGVHIFKYELKFILHVHFSSAAGVKTNGKIMKCVVLLAIFPFISGLSEPGVWEDVLMNKVVY